MEVKDIPIFGGIIEGVRIYSNVTVRIMTERTQFISNLKRLDNSDLRLSMQYFEIGIVTGLIYLVPFFVLHDQSASKFIFVLRQLTSIFIYTSFLYGSLKLLKVHKATFKNTITIMGFLWGLMFVLNFVLLTPILIAIGPEMLFSGSDNSWIQKVDQEVLLTFSMLGTIGGFAFIALWLYLILPWLSLAFLITKKRALAALFIGGVPSGVTIAYILDPLFSSVERALGNWLIAL